MLTQADTDPQPWYMRLILTDVEAHVLGVDPLGHDLPLHQSPHLSCLTTKSKHTKQLQCIKGIGQII